MPAFPVVAGGFSIQCSVDQARVAEETEHGPAIRLRDEVGGKPRHRGVGVAAGRRHDLASRGIACKPAGSEAIAYIQQVCGGKHHS